MTMTDAELAKIRARAEAATPGPWVSTDIVDDADEFCGYWSIQKPGDTARDRWLIDDMETITGQDIADADFVAAARTDIPALLDELAAARKEVGILKPVVEMYASGFRGSRLATDALDMVKESALHSATEDK